MMSTQRQTGSAEPTTLSPGAVASIASRMDELDSTGQLDWGQPSPGFAEGEFVRVHLSEESFPDGMRYTALIPLAEMEREGGPRSCYLERSGGLCRVVDVAGPVELG